jgi:hypothetical protein
MSDSQGPPDQARAVRRFAAGLRCAFAQEIAKDARRFKKLAVYHLKRSLPPLPGRPPKESLTRAIELRKEGMDWRQIYPLCIPGHSGMPAAVRRQAETNLRGASRSRRNAAKRRRGERAEPRQQPTAPKEGPEGTPSPTC